MINKNKPAFFKVSDYVLLEFHGGYNIPGLSGKTKIKQQLPAHSESLKGLDDWHID